MNSQNIQNPDLWPLVVYVAAVLIVTASLLGLSYILGERHQNKRMDEPYESGLVPTGTAWIRFDVKYYMYAVFFVILDLESIFIFAWAVTVREAGWAGYVAIVIFIGVLLAALFYLWRMGALSGIRNIQGRV
ncbi:MAG: NADH-quinone oxidoreductase subunit A [Smithella sp.]